MIVLLSGAGLLSDVLAQLQDCRKCGRVTVVQTSWAVVQLVAILAAAVH